MDSELHASMELFVLRHVFSIGFHILRQVVSMPNFGHCILKEKIGMYLYCPESPHLLILITSYM